MLRQSNKTGLASHSIYLRGWFKTQAAALISDVWSHLDFISSVRSLSSKEKRPDWEQSADVHGFRCGFINSYVYLRRATAVKSYPE